MPEANDGAGTAPAPSRQEPAKRLLHARLRANRATFLEKLDGLPEWQQRLPVTPTGTNLLGVLKHLSLVELGYLVQCFGRPVPTLPDGYLAPAYRLEDEQQFDEDDDLWLAEGESGEGVRELAAVVAAAADETVEALDLDAVGFVPWWGPRGREVTLAELLVHLLDETSRHLGHADIVRELLDGGAGYRAGNSNLPQREEGQWRERYERLEAVALAVRDAEGKRAEGGASA